MGGAPIFALSRAARSGKRHGPYAAFQLLYWSAPGLWFPFFFPLLLRRGVPPAGLGVIGAVSPLCALVAPPAVGWLCDRTGRSRGVLMGLLLGGSAVLPLFTAVRGLGPELAVALAFGLLSAPQGPLGDALTVAFLREAGGAYGRIRLWGSVGFALASALAGLLRQSGRVSLGVIFLLGAALALPSAAAVAAFPVEVHGLQPRHLGRQPLTPAFLWLLVLSTANLLAMNAQGSYFSVLLAHLGGGPLQQGIGWAVPAALEVPFFFWAEAIAQRVGVATALLLAFGCECAALAVIAAAPHAWAAVAGMALQGPAFGLFDGAAVPAVDRLVPPQLRATGQALLWASCFGAGSILGNLGAGAAVRALGLEGLYRALALYALLAALLFAWAGPRLLQSPPPDPSAG